MAVLVDSEMFSKRDSDMDVQVVPRERHVLLS